MITIEDVLLLKKYGKYVPVYNIILLNDNYNIEKVIESYLNKYLSIIDSINNLYIIKTDDFIPKYGLSTNDGNIITYPIYDFIDNNITNNRILVRKNNKYGYIDTNGTEIIPCTRNYSYYYTKENISKYNKILPINIIFKCPSMIDKSIFDISSNNNTNYNFYDFINHKFIYIEDYKIGLKITLSNNTYIIDENTNTKENNFIKVLKRN